MSGPHAFVRGTVDPTRCNVCGETEHHLSHVDPSNPPAHVFESGADGGRCAVCGLDLGHPCHREPAGGYTVPLALDHPVPHPFEERPPDVVQGTLPPHVRPHEAEAIFADGVMFVRADLHDEVTGTLAEEREKVAAVARRYHEGLSRIAGQQSGVWGRIADEALTGFHKFTPHPMDRALCQVCGDHKIAKAHQDPSSR